MPQKALRARTCCFTGHRHIAPDRVEALKGRLREELCHLVARGYCYFGCGGALGFDMLAGEAVLQLKATYPHICLILVLPCRDQARKWAERDIHRYENLKARADKVVYIADQYFEGCMHLRNRHLIHGSSLCLCYYTGTGTGGTAFTVAYAAERQLEIINLAEGL